MSGVLRLYYPYQMPFTCESLTAPGSGPDFEPRPVIHAIAKDSKGRILLGGAYNFCDGIGCYHVARLERDGNLDPSFASASLSGLFGVVRSLAASPDGMILLGTCDGKLVRLYPDGGLASIVQTDDPLAELSRANPVYSLIAEPDGRILMGGSFLGVSGQLRSGIMRLMGSPFLSHPTWHAEVLRSDFWTVRGRSYHLESSDSVSSESWQPEGTVEGDFSWHGWEVPMANLPQRFFRLRVE